MTHLIPSKKESKDNIVKIFWSFRKDILLILLSTILLCLGIETLYRTGLLSTSPLSPSIGSPHRQFEVQWFRLKDYVEKYDGVDVIIIGNSSALMGINPAVFESSFENISNNSIRVFNFGIEGVAMETASVIGKILIDTYNPNILIYAGGPENFNPQTGSEASLAILDTDWVKFQSGDITFAGWLADNSIGFQQYLIYRNWMQPDFSNQIDIANQYETRILENGHSPNTSLRSVNLDSGPNESNPIDSAILAIYQDHKIGEEKLNGFKYLAEITKQSEVQLVFVEVPKHTTFYDYFRDYSSARDEFIITLSPIFAKYNVLFIESEGLGIVPGDLFVDRSHMMPQGAEEFSFWLGEELAKIIE